MKIFAIKISVDADIKTLSSFFIRVLLCSVLAIKDDELVISVNEYGKPYLPNHIDINFNISHSGEYVICAMDSAPIGIDIEKEKLRDFETIQSHFFAPQEISYLSNCKEFRVQSLFYDIWTRKESYLKAIGTGFYADSALFSVVDLNGFVPTLEFGMHKWFFKPYNDIPNYKVAVCASNNDFPKAIEFWDIEKYQRMRSCALGHDVY